MYSRGHIGESEEKAGNVVVFVKSEFIEEVSLLGNNKSKH